MVFITSQVGYSLLPLAAYVLAGSLKFFVNFIRYRADAFKNIGLGGFPSTHTSIVSSAFFCGLFTDDFEVIVRALSMAVLLVVIIDAMDLRNRVGLIAAAVNNFIIGERDKSKYRLLRERNGHTWYEIVGGLLVGLFISYIFLR